MLADKTVQLPEENRFDFATLHEYWDTNSEESSKEVKISDESFANVVSEQSVERLKNDNPEQYSDEQIMQFKQASKLIQEKILMLKQAGEILMQRQLEIYSLGSGSADR